MNYTVVWKPVAKARLAELWMSASNRAAISRAADQIETMLRTKPFDVSESRQDQYRVLYKLPLAVAYAVSDDDRLVTVVHFVRFSRSQCVSLSSATPGQRPELHPMNHGSLTAQRSIRRCCPAPAAR